MSTTNTPTCNHCGYEFDSEETWYSNYSSTGEVHTGDCDESKLKCPNSDCGKIFYVMCVHEVKFRTTDEDGNEI